MVQSTSITLLLIWCRLLLHILLFFATGSVHSNRASSFDRGVHALSLFLSTAGLTRIIVDITRLRSNWESTGGFAARDAGVYLELTRGSLLTIWQGSRLLLTLDWGMQVLRVTVDMWHPTLREPIRDQTSFFNNSSRDVVLFLSEAVHLNGYWSLIAW